MTQIKLPDEAATLAMGARIAPFLHTGDMLALRGALGAGKTTFARGLIRTLTGETDVPSPTYTLVQIYETSDGELWHGDMYRLEQPQDCIELGLEDAFLDCICVIEWPDKLGVFLPKDYIEVSIAFDGEGRVATLKGRRNWIDKIEV